MLDFQHLAQALTLAEFERYVAAYHFGTVEPDFVVLHHTSIPATSWAPAGQPARYWDAGEAGMTLAQIKAKRLRQLQGIANVYEGNGWQTGPHLFIDDLFVYLMTPMYFIGTHAKWGNSFHQAGLLHYSIGIEVIGHHATKRWPAAVEALVGGAVRCLAKRLGIRLDYMYADGVKPGRATKIVQGRLVEYCPHPERLRFGGLSSHRDYNKIECPGDAITEDYYLRVIRGQPAAPSALLGTPYLVRSNATAVIRAAADPAARELGRASAGEVLLLVEPAINGVIAGGSAKWYKLAGQGQRFVHSSAVMRGRA